VEVSQIDYCSSVVAMALNVVLIAGLIKIALVFIYANEQSEEAAREG